MVQRSPQYTLCLLIGMSVAIGFVVSGCNDERNGATAPGRTHSTPPTKYDEDLWPLENGHGIVLSELTPKNPDDIKLARFVFNLDLLEVSHAFWRKNKYSRERAPELRRIGWNGGDANEPGVLVWASYIFQRMAREHPVQGQKLIEAMLCFYDWQFFEVEKVGSSLVRKSVSEDERNRIQRYFWVAFGDGRRMNVIWDADWEYWVTPRKPINEFRYAPARFIVNWNGREYKAAAVGEAMLAVPGLGLIATGDFRPGRAKKDRHYATCAIEVIVPSKKLVIFDERMDIEILRELD